MKLCSCDRALCYGLIFLFSASVVFADVTTAPQSQRVPKNGESSTQNLWEKGMALYNQKNYEEATKYFARLGFLDGAWGDLKLTKDSIYMYGECCFLAGHMDQSANGFKTFVTNYPDDKRTPQALLREIQSLLKSEGRLKEATEVWDVLEKRFPNSPQAKEARIEFEKIS